MKYINIIILLGLAGSTFGGGVTRCGSIQESTAALIQVAQTTMNSTIDYFSGLVEDFPLVGLSLVDFLNCHLQFLANTFVDSIEAITKLDNDYIFLALLGENEPPFTAPLDCIQSEILAYGQFIQNFVSINEYLNSLAENSGITGNTPCEDVSSTVQPYAIGVQDIVNNLVSLSVNAANAYNSIGKQDLYLQYKSNFIDCGTSAFDYAVAELLQIDVNLVIGYLRDRTMSTTAPLSCVEETVAELSDNINTVINQFNENPSTAP